MAEIKKAKMAPFYRSVCKELKWKEDSKLWTEMTAENEVEIKALDEKITDAEANLGESEHRSVENFSIWLLFNFCSREYVAGIKLISSILRILRNFCSHFSISRDTLLAKAEFLTKIGEKDAAVEAVRKTMEKTVGLGNRMDLLFHNIRIGLFWMDHSLIKANLEKATIMMEEGGKNERITIYL